MGKLGLPARDEAMAAVDTKPMMSGLGYVIAEVLGRAGDPAAVRALLRLAAEARSDIVARIRRELGPIRDPAVNAEYIKALKSPAPGVRALAAFLLSSQPGKKTTAALTKQARREKDAGVLETVLDALGEHGDPRSIDLLIAATKKRNPALRGAAIRALAKVGTGVPKVQRRRRRESSGSEGARTAPAPARGPRRSSR